MGQIHQNYSFGAVDRSEKIGVWSEIVPKNESKVKFYLFLSFYFFLVKDLKFIHPCRPAFNA